MTDTYQPTAAEPDDATDGAPVATDAPYVANGAGKLSQEEANYRRGEPTKHCGVCDYYEGNDTKSCTRVEGPISGYGISDVFAMQKNPFGSKIGPREAAMIDSMMQTGPDQSEHVNAPPPTRIGNRVY